MNTPIRIGMSRFAAGAQAAHQRGDAGVDRAGLHRQTQEAADDQNEQRDVDRAVQRAAVVRADVAVGGLDAVGAGDRREQRAAQNLLRILWHGVVGTRNRRAVRVQSY